MRQNQSLLNYSWVKLEFLREKNKRNRIQKEQAAMIKQHLQGEIIKIKTINIICTAEVKVVDLGVRLDITWAQRWVRTQHRNPWENPIQRALAK